MAAVFVLTLVAAGLYLLRQPDLYRAESLLLVEGEAQDPDDALNMGFVAGPTDASAASQLLILQQSSALAQRAAERLQEVGGGPRPGSPSSASEGGPSPATAEQLRQLVAFVPYEPNAIGVVATSTDPRRAALMANAFAEAAIAHSRETGGHRVTESRAFIEQRLSQAQQELQGAEADLQEYMQREGVVGLDAEAQTVVANQSMLESTMLEAQVDLETRMASLRAKERELQRIRPVLTQQVASGVSREIETAQQRIADLELRLEQFYQNNPDARDNPDSDPRTRSLRSELTQWRRRVTELSAQYVRETLAAGGTDPSSTGSGVNYAAQLERQIAEDRIAISGLESRLGAQWGQMRDYTSRRQSIPQQSVGLAQLERRKATAEQLYTYLTDKLQEASIAEESEIGSLRLLREAAAPVAPINQGPAQVLLLSALLGLLLGFGAAAVQSKLDTRLYTPEDVQGRGLSVLSVVPDMGHFIDRSFSGAASVPVEGQEISADLVALLAPYSAAAEAYRHLYTRIQFSRPDRVTQVVLVGSPEAGAGKSTTALNLALTMARANRRTLLIDADMRRPVVRQRLGLSGGPTLEEFLARPKEVEVASALVESASTGIPNLYALAVHKPVADPLEHLMSRRMEELFWRLRAAFDVIVVDTPPVLLAADAILLAPLCDVSILVASAGKTDAEALLQTQKELDDGGTPIVGVVLNRFDPSDPSYKRTYGYRQQHYAAYHEHVPQ